MSTGPGTRPFFPFGFRWQAIAGVPIHVRRHLSGFVDLCESGVGVICRNASFHLRPGVAPFSHIVPVDRLDRVIGGFSGAVVIVAISIPIAPGFDTIPQPLSDLVLIHVERTDRNGVHRAFVNRSFAEGIAHLKWTRWNQNHSGGSAAGGDFAHRLYPEEAATIRRIDLLYKLVRTLSHNDVG